MTAQTTPAPPNLRKSGWTPERRAKQAEAIRRWKPWAKSTGPKTTEGKSHSRYNAWKHGLRGAYHRRLVQALAAHRQFLKHVEATFRRETLKKIDKRTIGENTAHPSSPPRRRGSGPSKAGFLGYARNDAEMKSGLTRSILTKIMQKTCFLGTHGANS